MFFYNAAISLYFFAIRIASLFSSKVNLLQQGQSSWREHLQEKLKPFAGQSKIWVHCASVGEFEQGRPVIEGIKKNFPDYKIVLSFFSPSGYELHKNYELADVVTYLPKDTAKNAADFIEMCKPKAAIFVKYEFWLNFLFELQKRKIQTYLVSAVIKEHQPFFKWYGGIFKQGLKVYKTIFVQDEQSMHLLERLGISTGMLIGDTRIDRVLAIRSNTREIPGMEKFCERSTILIAGSSWTEDEKLLIPAFASLKKQFSDLKLILTPHEVAPSNIARIEKALQGLEYGVYTKGDFEAKDVVVMDTVGLLSSLYKHGTIAYIGGGFGSGIHNILEPAVFGLPVIFGPRHQKFNEAAALISKGGAQEIRDGDSLLAALKKLLESPPELAKAKLACVRYVDGNAGASEKILRQVAFQYRAG